MGEVTEISWATGTFNPWMGCQKVSPACAHCYAERDTKRFGRVVWGPTAERIRTSPENWKLPLRWNRAAESEGVRRRIFCASLADVFEDRADLEPWRADLWRLIEETPFLDWLLLTKRPENAVHMAPTRWVPTWPENVWLGTTAENQEWAEKRIPALLAVPARIRFVSLEPLLGPIDLMRAVSAGDLRQGMAARTLDWVIVGGESGPEARPMHPEWARSLRDQCARLGVPFHFKQWGEFSPRPDLDGVFEGTKVLPDETRLRVVNHAGGHGFHGEGATYMERVGKKAAGSLLDGVDHKAVPVSRG